MKGVARQSHDQSEGACMARYCIDAAISETAGDPGTCPTPGGGSRTAPGWDIVYQDHIEFTAADDAEAMDHAEAIQRRHDGAYLMICGGLQPSGWSSSPQYVERLFRVKRDGSLVAVVA